MLGGRAPVCAASPRELNARATMVEGGRAFEVERLEPKWPQVARFRRAAGMFYMPRAAVAGFSPPTQKTQTINYDSTEFECTHPVNQSIFGTRRGYVRHAPGSFEVCSPKCSERFSF